MEDIIKRSLTFEPCEAQDIYDALCRDEINWYEKSEENTNDEAYVEYCHSMYKKVKKLAEKFSTLMTNNNW